MRNVRARGAVAPPRRLLFLPPLPLLRLPHPPRSLCASSLLLLLILSFLLTGAVPLFLFLDLSLNDIIIIIIIITSYGAVADRGLVLAQGLRLGGLALALGVLWAPPADEAAVGAVFFGRNFFSEEKKEFRGPTTK